MCQKQGRGFGKHMAVPLGLLGFHRATLLRAILLVCICVFLLQLPFLSPRFGPNNFVLNFPLVEQGNGQQRIRDTGQGWARDGGIHRNWLQFQDLGKPSPEPPLPLPAAKRCQLCNYTCRIVLFLLGSSPLEYPPLVYLLSIFVAFPHCGFSFTGSCAHFPLAPLLAFPFFAFPQVN